jgi:twinkle protein
MTQSSKVVHGYLPCPVCPSSDAYFEYDDGHAYCFSCNYYKSNKKDYEDLAFTFEYLPWRGITKATMESYDVRTKIDPDGRPISIGFRYPNGSYKVRSLDEKVFRWEGINSPSLFGQDKCIPGAFKYITITEGEADALSLHQVLGGPVVSVQAGSSAGRDAASARSWLNTYERIYLAFDNDAVGREAAAAVARLFDYNKVYHVKFGTRKDANEYLQAGEEAILKNIWWSAKKYLPENIVSSLDDFANTLKQPIKLGVPYPFKALTNMTYGIRTGESVLITAREKVGKTEFMHIILHNLLKETQDVGIAGLFIEEPKQRTLQAIAGIELGKPVHLPDSGVSNDQVIEAFNKVVGRDDRLYLYSHFGSNDPEIILDTIRFLATACACKYVLFDHIGMAVSGLGGDNERVALDYLGTRLEMMVKELDFALIYVSHVNDFGQTRGSRYLGKLCDVRIDLMRETDNLDPDIRNVLQVTIPYQRFSYMSGPVGRYKYNPRTLVYTPEADNDNLLLPYDQSKAA